MNEPAKQIYNIEVLRHAMASQFLNYKQLAEKAGLDYHVVYRVFNYQREGRFRSPELIERIAITLKVPIDQVINSQKES